jgi:hypothetical protein
VPSESPPDKPPHTKLVKGRWYWDPPDRLRKSHALRTVSLGANTPSAWALARKLNAEHLHLGPGAPVPGTVLWLFESFLAGERCKSLATSTQRDYAWLSRRVLAPLQLGTKTFGEYHAISVKPRQADAIYTLLKAAHGQSSAHYACRLARRVWKWGARRGLTDPVNPWSGMELPGLPQRTQLWTQEQVYLVIAAAHWAGRPSIALATLLAYWFGRRQGDVLTLTWATLESTRQRTRKTGVELPIDVEAYPEVAKAIAETPRTVTARERVPDGRRGERREVTRPTTHVVVSECTGRPYNRHTFGHDWRKIANLAAIPKDLQFRDLRSTAVTELKDAGADVLELSTHTGHTTLSMARRYARPTQKQFRRAAARRLGGEEGEDA